LIAGHHRTRTLLKQSVIQLAILTDSNKIRRYNQEQHKNLNNDKKKTQVTVKPTKQIGARTVGLYTYNETSLCSLRRFKILFGAVERKNFSDKPKFLADRC